MSFALIKCQSFLPKQCTTDEEGNLLSRRRHGAEFSRVDRAWRGERPLAVGPVRSGHGRSFGFDGMARWLQNCAGHAGGYHLENTRASVALGSDTPVLIRLVRGRNQIEQDAVPGHDRCCPFGGHSGVDRPGVNPDRAGDQSLQLRHELARA